MTEGKAWQFDYMYILIVGFNLSTARFYCKLHFNLSVCVNLSLWINITLLVCSCFAYCDLSYNFASLSPLADAILLVIKDILLGT